MVRVRKTQGKEKDLILPDRIHLKKIWWINKVDCCEKNWNFFSSVVMVSFSIGQIKIEIKNSGVQRVFSRKLKHSPGFESDSSQSDNS